MANHDTKDPRDCKTFRISDVFVATLCGIHWKFTQEKLQFPGDSSRDLFFPRSFEVTNKQPLKRSLTHPLNFHVENTWLFVAVTLLKDCIFVVS